MLFEGKAGGDRLVDRRLERSFLRDLLPPYGMPGDSSVGRGLPFESSERKRGTCNRTGEFWMKEERSQTIAPNLTSIIYTDPDREETISSSILADGTQLINHFLAYADEAAFPSLECICTTNERMISYNSDWLDDEWFELGEAIDGVIRRGIEVSSDGDLVDMYIFQEPFRDPDYPQEWDEEEDEDESWDDEENIQAGGLGDDHL